jgi:hypothetical protein
VNEYRQVIALCAQLKAEEKDSRRIEAALSGNWKELKYIEYYLEHLVSLPGGRKKFEKLLIDTSATESNTKHQLHWRSYMSEFTAYWLLETRLNRMIKAFDAPSPKRAREKSDCDALCVSEGRKMYIEVKAAHDWTIYTPPTAIKELCQAHPGFSYIISTSRPDLVVTLALLTHLRLELELAWQSLATESSPHSVEVFSNDHRQPRDISILVSKANQNGIGSISFGFPPRNDEGFPQWLDSRMDDAHGKGADLLMLNYIFWEDGNPNSTLRTSLLTSDSRIVNSNNRLQITTTNKLTVREIIIFTPSGEFEQIYMQ